MSELLADPFSELTRKRQSMLLIAATITLLLSAELVTVTEVGVAGMKFALRLPHVAAWLAFAVTAYLLTAYLLGVWADWSISKAKGWSPLASVAEVKAGIVRTGHERYEELKRVHDELQKVDTEFDGRIDPISTRLREIDEELLGVPKVSVQYYELLDEQVELHRKKYDLLKQCSDLKKPLYLPNPMESIVSESRERTDINRTLSTYSNLTRLRLVIEILFPAAYAVFALLWTVHRN